MTHSAGRRHLFGMLCANEMLAMAEQCERMVDKADSTSACFLRDAAKQWRAMAAQLELLEQEPAYRIIRNQCRE
jgi:hypothetical protein